MPMRNLREGSFEALVPGEGQGDRPEPGNIGLGGRVGVLQPLVAAAPAHPGQLGVAELEVEAAVVVPEVLQLVQDGEEQGAGGVGVLAERILLAGEHAPRRVVAEHFDEN